MIIKNPKKIIYRKINCMNIDETVVVFKTSRLQIDNNEFWIHHNWNYISAGSRHNPLILL